MSPTAIAYLISFYASIGGVEPKLALAVAQHESGLNPNAIGLANEVGIFQIKPQYEKRYSRKRLFDVVTNIRVGIERLAHEQKTCVHRKRHEFLICFNIGAQAAKRIRVPSRFPYVVAVDRRIAGLK